MPKARYDNYNRYNRIIDIIEDDIEMVRTLVNKRF